MGGRLLAGSAAVSHPMTSCRWALRCSSGEPHHLDLCYTGIDGVRREVAVTAFPLMGREQELFGAVAIFWHV